MGAMTNLNMVGNNLRGTLPSQWVPALPPCHSSSPHTGYTARSSCCTLYHFCTNVPCWLACLMYYLCTALRHPDTA